MLQEFKFIVQITLPESYIFTRNIIYDSIKLIHETSRHPGNRKYLHMSKCKVVGSAKQIQILDDSLDIQKDHLFLF